VVRLSRNPILSINHTISTYLPLHTPPYIKQHPQPLSHHIFSHHIHPSNISHSTIHGLLHASDPTYLRRRFLPQPRASLIPLPLSLPIRLFCTYFFPSSITSLILQIQLNARLQIGTPTASISNEIAAVQQLMKASGLSYSMHSAGTTVGSFSLSSPDSSYPQC
jgi:hypothetical protein